jgi:hypothetical protein
VPIAPTRIFDTRPGYPPASNGDAKLNHGQEFQFDAHDLAEVSDTATGLAVNLTAEGANSAGFVSLYPANLAFSIDSPPTSSNLNYRGDGSTVANMAMVGLAPGAPGVTGAFKGFNYGAAVHLIIDVVGYYT